MTEIIEFLRMWSEKIMMALGYPGIFLIMFLECIFPPIPSEVIMPLAGFLVGQGEFNFWLVMLSGTLGSLVGALLLYYLGAWADEAILRSWVRKHGKWIQVSETDIDRVEKWFAKHGQSVIFFGRMIPIIRSLISIPAGMERMPMTKFILYTVLGSILWNFLLTYGGMLLGENWQQIIGWIDIYQNVVLVILALLVLLFFVWLIVRRKKAKMASQAELAAETPEIEKPE
jgi:membrane protein DedA with SNARE-associated domain